MGNTGKSSDTLRYFANLVSANQEVARQLLALKGATSVVAGRACFKATEAAVVLSVLEDERLGEAPGRRSAQQHGLFRKLCEQLSAGDLHLPGCTVHLYKSEDEVYLVQHARAERALNGGAQPLLVRDFLLPCNLFVRLQFCLTREFGYRTSR
jgi:hypothetical protein